MANLLIATPVLSDAGSFGTIGDQDTATPASNLLKLQPTDIWKTTTLTAINFTFDLGATKTFDTFAMLYTNATAAATWRIRTANTEANLTAAPTYDSGTVAMLASTDFGDFDRPHAFLRRTPALSNRWVRFDITNAANPDNVFKVGRLYIANSWQPTRNMRFGWQLGFIDQSVRTPTSGGQTYINRKDQLRTVALTLSFMSRSEMFSNAYELFRLRGDSKDVLMILDPSEATHLNKLIVYGLLEQRNQIVNQLLNFYETELFLTELL